MPLRRLQARLQVPHRLRGIVRPEEVQGCGEDSACRFCWLGPDEDEGGELLAPCRCSGTVVCTDIALEKLGLALGG